MPVHIGQRRVMQHMCTNRRLELACSGASLYRRFEAPTRAAAVAAVLRLVRAHPEHDIVIGVDSLGKGAAFERGCGGSHEDFFQM